MSYKRVQTNSQFQLKDGREHVYYNIRYNNAFDGVNSASSDNTVINLTTSNILEKQSDYDCAIDFWSIRGQIPVMIMKINEGLNPNINSTPYGFCFSYLGNNYPSNIIYTSDQAVENLPLPPNLNNGIQDLTNNYYYIYTFQKFLDLMNTAMESAYTNFNIAHPAIHSSAPFFQYDEVNGLISLVAEYSYSSGNVGNKAEVFVNALLFNYIESIKVLFLGYNQSNNKDFKFDFTLKKGNMSAYAIPPNLITNPPSHIIVSQEYDLRYLWANIKQILITSSSIATREEYLPFSINPQQFQQTINGKRTIPNNQFNPTKTNVLSYYDIDITNDGAGAGANWRQYIRYDPFQLKYMDLVNDSPLNVINIEVYMITGDGVVLPLQIPSEAQFNIKFQFRKKLKNFTY
tara:strand:- start:677 stop:1885 length:1209 start_codon:yes stop_codon:yes gene_type:complete